MSKKKGYDTKAIASVPYPSICYFHPVAVAPNGFDDVSPQLAPEFIDHAGNPCPAGVKGVRSNGLIDLAGGKYLSRPAGQQEQNVELHRGQFNRRTKQPYQVMPRVNFQ